MQHGVGATAGGHVPWWIWSLLVWSALALFLAVVLGGVIRTADRYEAGADRESHGPLQRLRLPVPRSPGQVGGQSVGPKTVTQPPEVSSSSRPPQVEP